MKEKELREELKAKGFNEEKLDSGYNYTKTEGTVDFVCYIEPDIEVEFITVYRWKNNDVKGTYNISIKNLINSKDSLLTFFRKTKNNLPQNIGEFIDTHQAVDEGLQNIFE